MRFWLPILVLFCLPGLATAGAWPRAHGAWFVSLSHTVQDDAAAIGTPAFDPSGYTALYLEHGLTPRLTFGLDAGIGDAGAHSTIAFLRLPFGPEDRPLRTAWQAGIGQRTEAGRTEPLLQLGLSLGRGIETRFGQGWLSLDTQVQHRVETGGTVYKADATVGVKPRDGTMLILQLQAGAYPGSDPTLRLAPSVVQRFAPGRYVEAGITAGLLGEGSVGLKIGTWFEF